MSRVPCGWIALFAVLLGEMGAAVLAQTPPDPAGPPVDEVDALLDDVEDDAQAEALLADLADLADQPLDLNTASAVDLAQIPTLGPLLARRIVAFRKQFGPFASLEEVRAVEGLTAPVYASIRPYLRLASDAEEPSSSARRTASSPASYTFTQRLTRRLDLGRGYRASTTQTAYLGGPYRLYTRVQAHYRRTLRLNVTADHDPAEPFDWNPAARTYGYDFLSAHAAVRDVGRLQTLVIGDFAANFGQGLVLWRTGGFGKGRATTAPLVRRGAGLTPYGSTEENRFFRGIGTTLALTSTITATAFASRRSLDGTLSANALSATDSLVSVATLATSGLHRTPSEHSKKDAVTEIVTGGAVSFATDHLALGLTGYRAGFSLPFETSIEPYQQFRFTGQTTHMLGLHGSLVTGRALWFGEGARSARGSMAGIGGVHLRSASGPDLLLLVRHYPAAFVSLHGFAFGERSGATQNESGVYLGLQAPFRQAWTLAAFFDQFRFPWLRFGVPRPTVGHEALAALEFHPGRGLSSYLQARRETKEIGVLMHDHRGLPVRGVAPQTRRQLRWHGTVQLGAAVRLRARLEWTHTQSPQEAPAQGFLLYQDLRWQPTGRLQLDVRLSVFDTDGGDARLYTFENDLPGTFSSPSFAGTGQRAYVLVRCTLWRSLILWLKYGETHYEHVRTVGTGLDEVPGNRIRELRTQLRWRF